MNKTVMSKFQSDRTLVDEPALIRQQSIKTAFGYGESKMTTELLNRAKSETTAIFSTEVTSTIAEQSDVAVSPTTSVWRYLQDKRIPAPRKFGLRISAWNIGELKASLAA